MSNLKKSGNFVKFLVDVKTKNQVQSLLHTLTPDQNLAIREIIYNVSHRYPNRYKRLVKKVHKPLSIHFLKNTGNNCGNFCKNIRLLF